MAGRSLLDLLLLRLDLVPLGELPKDSGGLGGKVVRLLFRVLKKSTTITFCVSINSDLNCSEDFPRN